MNDVIRPSSFSLVVGKLFSARINFGFLTSLGFGRRSCSGFVFGRFSPLFLLDKKNPFIPCGYMYSNNSGVRLRTFSQKINLPDIGTFTFSIEIDISSEKNMMNLAVSNDEGDTVFDKNFAPIDMKSGFFRFTIGGHSVDLYSSDFSFSDNSCIEMTENRPSTKKFIDLSSAPEGYRIYASFIDKDVIDIDDDINSFLQVASVGPVLYKGQKSYISRDGVLELPVSGRIFYIRIMDVIKGGFFPSKTSNQKLIFDDPRRVFPSYMLSVFERTSQGEQFVLPPTKVLAYNVVGIKYAGNILVELSASTGDELK